MIGYIYALYDKDENDVIYIGQSVNPANRLKIHNSAIYYYRNDGTDDKYLVKERTYWGQFILAEVEFEEKKELYREEAFWINMFRSWGFPLKNSQLYKTFDFNLAFIKLKLCDDLYKFVLKIHNELSDNGKRKHSLSNTIFHIIREYKKLIEK